MLVSIKEKSVYGNTLMYPNNETAILFAQLLNKKTFDNKDLKIINELGYKIDFIKL
jgi:hypothetical protein